MLDDIIDYMAGIRDRPVWQPIPEETRALLREPPPRGPQDLGEVHRTFLTSILPFATGNTHPGFMGWVHGGGNPAGMLGEMLAAGLNANLGGRDHMPIEVERQIARWMAELMGFPETASGLFVTGTSMANFLAVLIARAEALGTGVRRQGLLKNGSRLTAYTSQAAHGCIAQALDISGIGIESLRIVPMDGSQRMRIDALREMVAQDRAEGALPFLVVGTAGSVDVGAIDDMEALADVAAQEKLWFHVDGAFGALGVLAPSVAPKLKGLERAQSIAFDFHKWGQVPYDAGFLLVRDGEKHRATFAAPAAYLRRETRGLAGGSPWPCDFGPDLSRGFRALKTWFTLKVNGTERLGEAIERTCEVARHLEVRVRSEPKLELLAPAQLNIVCFRYGASDEVNAEIVADLHESGIAATSTTTIAGKLAIRAALVNHRVDFCDVDALVEAVLHLGKSREGTS